MIVDRDDHRAYNAAALNAHCPAAGRVTVQPTPATTTVASLAQDLLYALGKRLLPGDGYGTWADSLQPAWDAAAAWILAHRIEHVIVTRTDRLTHRRWAQLSSLQTRTGIRLTMVWHAPPTNALTALLAGLPHQVIEDLEQARCILTEPAGDTGSAQARRVPQRAAWAVRESDARIAVLAPDRGVVVTRARRAPCAGADAALPAGHTPAAGAVPVPEADAEPGHPLAEELFTRLHRVAHPVYAGALAAAVITGLDIDRLAQIRGVDLDEHACVLKTHGRTSHHACRIHPVPGWARPLLLAVAAHHQLSARPVSAALFPMITMRGGNELTTHADACGVNLARRADTPRTRQPSR
ncbi:hypothetical protein [Streptomyces sp. NBC_01320]|uniref:hypothetical protein n=1 Tax=Streptomyces sp. NBC_01320 TaxID=2903824 RepID=UPI002E0E2FEA|nr:hypothetical protein OG395_57805 [Streptomyces sp. NBC_01320]